tara:strand:+ start:2243 stop:2353 length:111 start_codon:yes stop_codon:yes gene_type:complete
MLYIDKKIMGLGLLYKKLAVGDASKYKATDNASLFF